MKNKNMRNKVEGRLVHSIFTVLLVVIMFIVSVNNVNAKTATTSVKEERYGILEEPIGLVENVDISDLALQAMNSIEEVSYISIDEVQIDREMNLNEPIGVSKEDFCNLLYNMKYDYVGFYEKNAETIWNLCQEYQINELFICGIFAIESGWGTKHTTSHNYGSMMSGSGKLIHYENDEEGIEANIKLLAESYLSPEGRYYKGTTLSSIASTYCPPNAKKWQNDVYSAMNMILQQ